MVDIMDYIITEDAIRDAKDVSFDVIFQHYGIRYSESKSYNLVDYLCPFHSHDTNTFHASKWYRDRKYCQCFACNEKLDTIDFVSKYDGISFKEAVITILDMTGQSERYLKRKNGVKYEKKPFQLRYLTNDEKRVLGFSTAHKNVFLSRDKKVVVPNGCIVGVSDEKRHQEGLYPWMDYEIESYLTVQRINTSDMWRELMKEDPMSYRTMILGKVSESFKRLNLLLDSTNELKAMDDIKKDIQIVNKIAKDFGYYRVVNYIRKKKKGG